MKQKIIDWTVLLGTAAVWIALMWALSAQFARIEPRLVRITNNGGGELDAFIDRYHRQRLAGTRFIIDGLCMSACTMINGLIPDDRVCVTPYARLAFHSATDVTFNNGIEVAREFSEEGTRIMWHVFQPKLRALLKDKYEWDGDDPVKGEHPQFIYVEGDDLLSLYAPCKED